MRIISQDGEFDFPYESTAIYVGCETARCKSSVRCSFQGMPEGLVLAQYSSDEKSKRAMEMLRSVHNDCFYEYGGVHAATNSYIPSFGFTPPKTFKFPKDSEVKVDEA